MDGHRFDALARALARRASRRHAVSALIGGLGGLVAAAGLGANQTAAQRIRGEVGTPCLRAGDCASFFCVDGYCCDTPCAGQCEACNVAGAEGTCSPVMGASVAPRPACSGTDVCQATCDGIERRFCTQYPGLDVVCAPTECDHGWLITYSCGGDGTCHPMTATCFPYLCNAEGTGCGESCAGDDDCAAGANCVNGRCVGEKPIGEPCANDAECVTGFCVNGVCCVERCGTCEVCNIPGSEGFCAAGPDNVICGPINDDLCCEGDCIDVQIDVEHCGQCHNTCPGIANGRAVCRQGTCDIECLPGFMRCDVPETVCVPESDCCTDVDCAPGEWCDIPAHTCQPDRPYGDPCQRNCLGFGEPQCSQDNMCLSDICFEATDTCGCSDDSQCPEPQFCNETDNTCDPDRPYGQPCNRDAMCATGVCNEAAGTCACDDDGDCGGGDFCCEGACISEFCPTLTLAGQNGPTSQMYVDDHLTVELIRNGTVVETLVTPLAVGFLYDPVAFSAQPGDQLHIVADEIGVGGTWMQPIYLYCAASPCFSPQFMGEFPLTEPNVPAGTYFDETITINLQPI